MMPWQAFGVPTGAMRQWAAQQGQCRVNTLPYSEYKAGLPAGGPRYSGGGPYAQQQTRYGNLGRNIQRAYYANLSRKRRRAYNGG